MREDLEAPLLQLLRKEPAGIQLGDDAVQAQLVSQVRQAINQSGRAAEGDFFRLVSQKCRLT